MSLAVSDDCRLPRKGFVRRSRLLSQLARAPAVSLVSIVAPAGYGKTALLANLVADDERPSAWVSLEQYHRCPVQMLLAIGAALGEIGPLDGALADVISEFSSLPTSTAGESVADEGKYVLGLPPRVLSVLASALERRRLPFLLALDNAHLTTTPGAVQLLALLATHLPSGSRLALASRSLPDLPLGRLRAERALLEFDWEDLAMTSTEAAELLRGAGVRVGQAEVRALMRRTEGWPAGLSLAALSAGHEPDTAAALKCVAGSDHLLASYMREEFLGDLTAEEHRFLLDSSVLERLSGPLCDTVLEHPGCGSLLDRLASGPLPLGPIDRAHQWFRCHSLLREALQSELSLVHPERFLRLHMRASEWYSERGDVSRAIEHAAAAGSARLVGELLWRNLPAYLSSGRGAEVRGWLGRFSPKQVSAHAPLALAAAHSALALGDLGEAEHWGLVAAAALARSASIPEVASLPAGVAVIEAVAGRQGLLTMATRAAQASAIEDQDSPWRSIFCLLRGVAHHLTGDRAGALEHLQDGIVRGALVAPNIETLCLSQLALVVVEEGDWDRGLELIARAVRQVERHSLASYPASALTFAVSAEVRCHAGRASEGKRDARRASHLLAGLSDFIPWYEAETRIVLARAALRLSGIGEARALLAEASRLARQVPDAVVFENWLDGAWGLLDSASASALAGPATLTVAELRVLRFLPTHLALREIGSSLHVSSNTIKTHVGSVYRKLGVSSRSEAVARASSIGLLEGSPTDGTRAASPSLRRSPPPAVQVAQASVPTKK